MKYTVEGMLSWENNFEQYDRYFGANLAQLEDGMGLQSFLVKWDGRGWNNGYAKVYNPMSINCQKGTTSYLGN